MPKKPSNKQYTFGDNTRIEGDFVVGEKVVHIHPPPTPRLPLEKPERAAHFTGREKQLQQLIDSIQPGAVVTLCGPGGIGKSALAAEAVWALAPASEPPNLFPQGILFHTFNQQPQSELAFQKIAYLFGEELRPTPREAARRALAGRTALLVLDGAEACDDLPAVLAVRGNCGVLVTSRRRSDAPEGWLDVPALDEAAAVSLLCAFAGEIEPGIATEISVLCARLPLALRLAGRYLAATHEEPQAYLAWLRESPLNALDWRQREQDSVPLLMEHSLQQVNDNARAALSVAGALALSPFDLEPLQAVLEMPEPAWRKALGELVDYGLLLRGESGWSIRHALVHAYAKQIDLLEKDSLAKLGNYYAALAEEQVTRGREGFIRLDAALAHLLAVAENCLSQGLTYIVRRVAYAVDEYLDLQGHWTQRRLLLDLGLIASRTDGDQHDQAAFLNQLGLVSANLGYVQKAVGYYDEALRRFQIMNDKQREGIVLNNLGNAHKYLGETTSAIEFFKRSLAIKKETRNIHGEEVVLGNLGLAYIDLNNVTQAIKYHKRALKIASEIGNQHSEGTHLCNLGISYAIKGETKKSIIYFKKSIAISRRIGSRSGEGYGLSNLAHAYADLGNAQKAIVIYEQALTIRRQIGHRRGESIDLYNLGLVYEEMKEYNITRPLWEKALKIMQETGDPRAEELAQALRQLPD